MSKCYLFKSLFVAAGLAMSSMGAYAAAGDVTTNANIDFSNAITDGAVAGTVGSMTIGTNATNPTTINADGHLVLGSTTNSVTISTDQRAGTKDKVTVSFDLAFGKLSGKSVGFSMVDTAGAAIASFSFIPYNSTLTTNLGVETTDMYYASNTVIWDRKVNFTIVLDYNQKTITTTTVCYKSGTSKAATTATHTVTMTNTNPMAVFNVTSNYNNSGRYCQFDNLLIQTTAGDYTATTKTITYKYVDSDGNEISTSDLPSDAITSIVADSSSTYTPIYPASFSTDDYIYTYASGGDAITVTDNATITLVYTKTVRNKVDVVLNCVNGDGKILSTKTVFSSYPEGKTAVYGFSKYIIYNDTLYEATQNSPSYYVGSVAASSTPFSITYTAKTIATGTPAYFADFGDTPNTNISSTDYLRCSGGQTTSSNSSVTLVPASTLTDGLYTFEIAHYKNRAPKFYVGDNQFGVFATSGNSGTMVTTTFTDIPVIGEPAITATPGGSLYTDNIDYILAIRTGDLDTTVPVSVTSTGLATYCPKYNLDFSSATNIYAYKATVNGSIVNLTKVNTVAAGEGVLLHSLSNGEATENIPVISSATANDGNAFVGTLYAQTIPQTNGTIKNYVLSNGTNGFSFYLAATGGQALAANKAYLPIAASSAKSMTFVFDSGVTGINEMSTPDTNEGAYYSVQGVRVGTPTKGIYIRNNKKVIIK